MQYSFTDRFLKNSFQATAAQQRSGDRPKVSVLMPVYNGEKYLKESVESILAQSYPEWELVCYDDGSTDGSRALLERYAAQDSRIIVIGDRENHGRLHGRNELIRFCRTPLATWLDQDDFYEPAYLALAVTVQQREDFDVVQLWESQMMTQDINTPSGLRFSPSPQGKIYGEAILPTVLSQFVSTRYFLWTKLFKTSLLKRVILPFEDRYYSDDLFYAAPLLGTAKSFVSVNTGEYVHRYRGGGVTDEIAQFPIEKLEPFCKMVHDCLKWWLEYFRREKITLSQEQYLSCTRSCDIQQCLIHAKTLYESGHDEVWEIVHRYFCDGERLLAGEEIYDAPFIEAIRKFEQEVIDGKGK